VSLLDEDGNDVITPIQGQFSIPRSEGRGHGTGRFVMEFNSVEFKKYGSYTVSVTVEGLEVASIPFRVHQPPKPPPAAS
jgi:hypothetical protein